MISVTYLAFGIQTQEEDNQLLLFDNWIGEDSYYNIPFLLLPLLLLLFFLSWSESFLQWKSLQISHDLHCGQPNSEGYPIFWGLPNFLLLLVFFLLVFCCSRILGRFFTIIKPVLWVREFAAINHSLHLHPSLILFFFLASTVVGEIGTSSWLAGWLASDELQFFCDIHTAHWLIVVHM